MRHTRPAWRWFIPALAVCLAAPPLAADEVAPAPAKLEYNRHIRPILSNNCFKCHGPDAKERQAGLRLDQPEVALHELESGETAIVPGKPDESEVVARIFSSDPDVMMPPPDSNKKLTDAQRQLLKQWIAEGAEYQKHWSLIAPKSPAAPPVAEKQWPRNPIDHFILARLESDGLKHAPEADRTTLIRRLTLDLTGLPPTPAEVDAFLADESPNAYEKVVDRLLSSPHFGERMAMDWLDAARFADTHGFHIDSGRDMTRWREWVIASFNRNLPFDQFTIDQLAGDMLPNPSLDQRIASGFNRNHMINFEGGAIPEEYHNAYIVDRVNTTSTVFLGMTVGCAQCHDHKFDPITQKEYYQLYAFFHNVPENGLDGSKGNATPVIKAPSSDDQQKLDELAASIKQVEGQLSELAPKLAAAEAEWERQAGQETKPIWTPIVPSALKASGDATFTTREDKSILVEGANPATDTYTIAMSTDLAEITAVRVEALADDRFNGGGPGRSINGNIVLTDVRMTVAPRRYLDGPRPVKFKAAIADYSQSGYPVANAIDADPRSGWAIHPEVGKPHFAVFVVDEPARAAGAALVTLTLDFQSQFSQHQLGRFRVSLTDAADPGGSPVTDKIREILAIEPGKRNDQQRAELQSHFREHVWTESRQLTDRLAALRKEQQDLDSRIPTAMVMQEMDQPRDTFMLVRGQYDKPGDKVAADVPASLPPLPAGAPHNRLGLARWLVDPAHPLTSRVIVNRYWQMYFGTGIVKTSEDFGSQGEWPVHPELLDWLAAEFIQSGWDVKHLQKLIVTSAAYRQSSAVTAETMAADPENRLLARGPRLRLSAEFIRDQALSASGLLNPQVGGKSVSPYQPPGLWEELASRADGANWTAQVYVQSHGPDLYRRTMYTFWKRTSPPPTLATFDAPDRETCTVRRARTNTPLQALVLMNDPTYIESSRKLAERMMTEAGPSPEARIELAFRLAMARRPQAGELAVLRRIFDEQLAVYRGDEPAAVKLLDVGESKRNEKLDPAELAAWTMVASVILNLDETITKG